MRNYSVNYKRNAPVIARVVYNLIALTRALTGHTIERTDSV